jgi:hypothetical protein
MKSVSLCLTYKGVQNGDQSSADIVGNGEQMCKENASNCMSASLWSSIRSSYNELYGNKNSTEVVYGPIWPSGQALHLKAKWTFMCVSWNICQSEKCFIT